MCNDDAPIHRQPKARVVGTMPDGLPKPGGALPSVLQRVRTARGGAA